MFTRWKLNSIGYGPRVLTLVGILTIAVPLALYLCYWLLELFGIQVGGLMVAIRISITAGVGLLVLFVFLLIIEFMQDRFLDLQYRRTQNRKIRISDEYYECQYCGCQKVRLSDRQCPICGKDLL
jgi:hypothetical protein